MPPNDSDNALLIGEIHGIVQSMRETQKSHGDKLDLLDGRLRDQETTAAKHGAITGGMMAVGLALIIEGAKSWMRGGNGGGAS